MSVIFVEIFEGEEGDEAGSVFNLVEEELWNSWLSQLWADDGETADGTNSFFTCERELNHHQQENSRRKCGEYEASTK